MENTSRLRPRKRSGILRDLFTKKPLGGAGLVIIILFVLVAVFADQLAPTPLINGKFKTDVIHALQAPFESSDHVLGTDALGRDVLSYCIYGARTSVILCLSCGILSMAISVIIGTLSAVIGGWFDLIVQRLVDAWQSIPGMLIMLILVALLGNGLPQLILALSVPSGINGSRMIRSAAIAIRENGFVESAELLGARTLWIAFKHVVPNVMPLIIVGFAGSLGGTIMMESSLSFLGFGVGGSAASWGYLLTDQGRSNMFLAPWLSLIPGGLIALMVFAANMLGDALRDLLDPRLRGGVGSYSKKRLARIREKYIKKTEYNGRQYVYRTDKADMYPPTDKRR